MKCIIKLVLRLLLATYVVLFLGCDDNLVSNSNHEVTFNVTLPETTPENAVVSIVGSFASSGYPEWEYDAQEMELTQNSKGIFSITLNLKEGEYLYKYVLNGTSDHVEFGSSCNSISNRSVEISQKTTINDVVFNWKGFGDCQSDDEHTYTFIVTVPEGTPAEADVFIVGDMNSWYPNVTKLSKNSNGKYSITLTDVDKGMEYKYVMNGSFEYEELSETTTEGCAFHISNRLLDFSSLIEDEVKNWKHITVNLCNENGYPNVSSQPGKIVLVLNCVNEAEVCNNIVFAGDYNGWNLQIENLAKFEPIPDYDGWFKVVLTPSEPDAGITGKPNQLASDGSFPSDWAHQWYAQMDGDIVVNQCEILRGDAELQEEYNGEQALTMFASADVVYIRAYAWKKNPCIPTPTFTVTFNVTVPAGLEPDDVVYIVGNMNDWNQTETQMTKSGNVWTIILDEIQEGIEYKYVLNGSWDFEELGAIGEEGCAEGVMNRKVVDTTMNDVVLNFRGRTAVKCDY